MTSRRASDGGSVLSFTFLDVLMCTMGSLLLLLVVFGVIAKKATRERRAGEKASISLTGLTASSPERVAPPADANDRETDPADLARQLDELRRDQAELERRRVAVAERRREEEQRVSHLEEHERRLEHELAKLHVMLKALEAAEQKQSVDQDQADAEVLRLQELIRDTEVQLADMRKNGAVKKSYAIVPYKGAHGTSRRPVFVECTADAVTIQPEGIRLTVADFDGPLRSGNPLAAAIRAAHEELNGRAAAGGQADMPDPYPLFIVRPDGSAAYATAVDAIRSWDSDYGFEFIEADWKLKYPEPDPRLSQVMAHAVDEARQRQALLARVAPRSYAPRLSGRVVGGVGGGDAGAPGGFGTLSAGGSDRIGAHAGEGTLGGDSRYGGGGGNHLRGGGYVGAAGGNFSDEFVEPGAANAAAGAASITARAESGPPDGRGYGRGGVEGDTASGVAGGPYGAAGSTETATPASAMGNRYADHAPNGAAANGARQFAQGSSSTAMAGASGASGSAGASSGAAGTSAPAGGSSNGPSESGATGATARGAGAAGGDGRSASGMGLPTLQVGQQRRSSAADARGANWANAEASRRASAVTRPIKVVVATQQLAVVGTSDGAAAPNSHIVSFNQPVDRVLDELAAAIQEQIADWDIAGDGMYWRPTLVVSIEPGAQRQAERLAELLDNSGVDVRLPQATASAAQGGDRATR